MIISKSIFYSKGESYEDWLNNFIKESNGKDVILDFKSEENVFDESFNIILKMAESGYLVFIQYMPETPSKYFNSTRVIIKKSEKEEGNIFIEENARIFNLKEEFKKRIIKIKKLDEEYLKLSSQDCLSWEDDIWRYDLNYKDIEQYIKNKGV